MITLQENWSIYFSGFVVIFFILKAVQGYQTGILRRFIALVGSIASYWGAWILCDVFARHINIIPKDLSYVQDSPFSAIANGFLNQIIWFILLFFAFRIVVFVLERLAKGIQKIPGLHFVSSFFGSIFGILESFVWMVIFTILLTTPLFKNSDYIVEHSLLKQVNQVTSLVGDEYLAPMISSEGFSNLGKDFDSLSQQQRKAVEKWLEDNGIRYE